MKMADKLAPAYQFVLVVTLAQTYFIRFLPNFLYELLLLNSRSSSNTGFV